MDLKEDVIKHARNYKLMRHELLQGHESPAPRPDKIFRLRTGPEEKMDASRLRADEEPRVGKNFEPADAAHGPEHGNVFDIMFEDNLSVKTISICLYTFYSMSKIT